MARGLRIVGGSAGGRRLVAPKGGARPTTDRVKEALFNVLGAHAVDASVLDLYAGSGALGIEALSRGAAAATFVDHDAKALTVVRRNLEATGLGDRATVLRTDATTFAGGHFDLVLLDPPYAFGDEAWSRLLADLDAEVVVIESDREVPVPEPWRVLRAKKYGGTVVTIASRS